MATSGSTDFTVTRDEIIIEALELVDALATGQTVPTTDTTSASRSFNMYIKALQLEGTNLWTRTRIEEVLTASTVVTGSDTNAYVCTRSHTSSTTTEPITGTNWSSYWEKTSATSGGAWADVTAYNYVGDFTLSSAYINIDSIFIREVSNGEHSDYDIDIKPLGDYFSLSDKYSNGRGVPLNLYVDEQLSGITGYLYPTPEAGMIAHMLVNRVIEDFDAGTDNPDFPVRWFEALSYGLAVRLAPKYGIWGDKLAQLSGMYEGKLTKARKDDKETTTLFMAPTYI